MSENPANTPAATTDQSRPSRRRAAIFKITLAVVLIAAMVAAGFAFLPMLGDPEGIAAIVDRAGAWGPVLFIAIQALQVIAAPVPGQVTGLASGYLFGPWLGTLYCAIGGTIGCTVVFVLSRRLGRPFVEAFVSQRALQRFDYLADSGGAVVLLLIFLVPIFPDDIISYIAGLTRVPIHRLVLVALFGRLPGYFLFAFAGERAAAADTTILIAIGVVTLVLFGLLYWQRHRVEGFVRRLAHRRSGNDDAGPPLHEIKAALPAEPHP
ncbi:MAG: TVP38/TMEM64 family protein [Bauldia sp.]